MALETGTYISDLVATNPLGADDRSTADDHLRFIKSTILASFTGVTGAVTATHTSLNKTTLLAGISALSSSDDVLDNFPAGTLIPFQQTAAPTGWTKQTTHNNKALRVITGTVGSGGTQPFTTAFGAGKTTDSHTLTIAEMPSHTHTIAYYNFYGVGTNIGSAATAPNNTKTSSSTGGNAGHTHTLGDLDLQYVDIIIAAKV